MTCELCKNYKHFSFFNINKSILGKKITYPVCNSCNIKDFDDSKWLEEQYELIFRINKMSTNNFKKYNISYEDYFTMFVQQKGKCKTCGLHQKDLKKSLCVDHCHKSNKIRGLLCVSCNIALGLVKDNSDILNKMIDYLKNSHYISDHYKNLEQETIINFEKSLLKNMN